MSVDKHKPAPPPEADDAEQSKRFIDMAREVEADEDPEAFERAFRAVTGRGAASRRQNKSTA